MNPRKHPQCASSLALSLLVLALSQPISLRAAGAQATAPSPPAADSGAMSESSVQSAAVGDTVHIPVGRSIVLTAAAPLRRIYIGNPAVIQSYTSGQKEVVLTAKTPGFSSLVLWDTTGSHRLYTIAADVDPETLRSSISDAFPGSDIHAETSGGKVYLSGTAATDATADGAFKLASLYSKEVVNSIRVVPVHGKQVELKLRIVEVDRTRLEQLGINFFSGGKNTSATGTQQFGTTTFTPSPAGGSAIASFNPLNLLFFNASVGSGVNIQDLEQKQILQVLAEPTLTAISGQTARFLSGGEFPFPVVQGGTGNSTAVTIVFKPYGVKVDFTPTVNADGSIRLKVNPEVSTLDYSNSVTISGFTIPALSTRRAETEVEIKDGQSFVVSGLLDHRVTDNVNKVPGFADIPLLGQVFRSKSYQHSIIELVVLVTATLVDPLTHPEKPTGPNFTVPMLDSSKFDIDMNKQWKTGGPVPADSKTGQQP